MFPTANRKPRFAKLISMMRKLLIAVVLLVLAGAVVHGQSEAAKKGIEQYQAGNYAEAITVLQQVVEKDKNDRTAWRYLGAAYQKTGNPQKALEYFKESLVDFKQPYGDGNDKNIKVVVLIVEFAADGKIGFIVPVITQPDGLTEKAVERAKTMKFKPQKVNGKHQITVRLVSYSFERY